MRAHDTRFERIEPHRQVHDRDPDNFDRIAFALRALRKLRPKRMTVAVYPTVSSLQIQSGLDLHGRAGAVWAMVGIPPGASREHIAYALAELAGVASVPYAVQMLLAEERKPQA